MKEAPYNEILVKPENETPISKAAREKLQGVMDKLYNRYLPPSVSKVESNIKSSNIASSKNKEENDH
jgi:hypothetical protein